MQYLINHATTVPGLQQPWDAPAWAACEVARIDQFLPDRSGHRPVTELKLQYDAQALYGLFQVQDQYVRSVRVTPQSQVCQDSCVEMFVQPLADKGYFNFEFNCGGCMLCYYIKDHTRTANGFRKHMALADADLQQVEIFHSLPPTVEPEITVPTTWRLGFRIPFALLEQYVGQPLQPEPGTQWRANFYKCAGETSHPHWACWAPVPIVNFHLPEHFQPIVFAP